MSGPVAVTGIGVAAPNGFGAKNYWSATRAGIGGIDAITRFDARPYPSRLAGEVKGFVAEEHLPARLIPQTDRMTRMALVAADWALADAGIEPGERSAYDMGVVTAASAGGFEFGQGELAKLWSLGGRYVSAYQSFAWFYAVNTGQISIRHGMKGPSGVVVSDQAGGLDAIALGRRQIGRGTPVIVTGSIDASICPWGWIAQMAGGRMSTSAEPDRAYLPFDPAASGHVAGEGGAILILEDLAAAHARGARVYGVISGYGATFDPAPGLDRPPALQASIEIALREAGVGPSDVDVVFADAAAVPELDRVEAEAIAAIFGERGVPVTAPKTMTGRLLSGAGPLDVAAALLTIRDRVVPPTTNVTPDPSHHLDLVTGSARTLLVRTALVLARGHGGFNSALVIQATGTFLAA